MTRLASAQQASTDTGAEKAPPAESTTPSGEMPNLPPESQVSITDTREDPDKKYYFLGVRYRGTVIPQFLMNLFVDNGATLYSNSIGLEVDIRHGGASLIPWLVYTDFNSGDILFHEKSKSQDVSNFSDVNSSLKGIFIGVDQLWSANLVPTKLDFEFGFGVGIGAIFGNLMNNWVFVDQANGGLHGSNGVNYSRCVIPNPTLPPGGVTTYPIGCNVGDHQNPPPFPGKINGYNEPNWFNGGAVPVVFPHISIPQLGLRYKPIKQFVARLDVGFGLTGFWFGLSMDYGFEQMPAPAERNKLGLVTRTHDTL